VLVLAVGLVLVVLLALRYEVVDARNHEDDPRHLDVAGARGRRGERVCVEERQAQVQVIGHVGRDDVRVVHRRVPDRPIRVGLDAPRGVRLGNIRRILHGLLEQDGLLAGGDEGPLRVLFPNGADTEEETHVADPCHQRVARLAHGEGDFEVLGVRAPRSLGDEEIQHGLEVHAPLFGGPVPCGQLGLGILRFAPEKRNGAVENGQRLARGHPRQVAVRGMVIAHVADGGLVLGVVEDVAALLLAAQLGLLVPPLERRIAHEFLVQVQHAQVAPQVEKGQALGLGQEGRATREAQPELRAGGHTTHMME